MTPADYIEKAATVITGMRENYDTADDALIVLLLAQRMILGNMQPLDAYQVCAKAQAIGDLLTKNLEAN